MPYIPATIEHREVAADYFVMAKVKHDEASLPENYERPLRKYKRSAFMTSKAALHAFGKGIYKEVNNFIFKI